MLARPEIEIGRSNPDTDSSGYQTLQMLNLAEKYYKEPSLAERVLANAPSSNIAKSVSEIAIGQWAGQFGFSERKRDAKESP